MNMFKCLKLFLISPFLVSCGNTNNDKNITIYLDYVENGEVIEIDASMMYEQIVNQKKSGIYLLGNNQCSSCKEAKDFYNDNKHFNTYYLITKSISADDAKLLKKATAGSLVWNADLLAPTVYMFSEGSVTYRCDYKNYQEYTYKYIEIIRN